MCFRLLGASLPLLSEEQLQLVMRGDLIRHFGENMVISKVGIVFLFGSVLPTGPGQWFFL